MLFGSNNAPRNKPEPLWTAYLEGGCKVEGFDFYALTRRNPPKVINNPIVIYLPFCEIMRHNV